jgi:Ca-activated chloride channel family protein
MLERAPQKEFEPSKLEARHLLAPTPPMQSPASVTSAPAAVTANTDFNTAEYRHVAENQFLETIQNPLSTFSADVDTASYSNVRRFLNERRLPPVDAVRIEEMVNYFRYAYPQPTDGNPFSFTSELGSSPWNPDNKLLLIGIQGKNAEISQLPPSNFVFLIDSSGSMSTPDRLPLIQAGLKLLVQNLRPIDKVAIVAYAGRAGEVLPSTSGDKKQKISEAIDSLMAGGSTAGGAGIELAYRVAKQNFIEGGNNRVILATDGDFNVGVSSEGDLVRMIEEKRKDRIFLTTLGVGTDNFKDAKMQKLANSGNGNYYYLDGLLEAKKVLVNQLGGTLFTIAKDLKIQVEFNPLKVKSYRLIGYEKRVMNAKDFRDDKKDAGDIGVGHMVTALYEIISAGKETANESTTYLDVKVRQDAAKADELGIIRFRYKKPDGDVSTEFSEKIGSISSPLEKASDNFRFAAAVAEWALLLKKSEYKGKATIDQVLSLARSAKGNDDEGYRAEFIKLVELSQLLEGN